MASGLLVKIEATTAEEVCGRYPVPAEARALLQPGMNPGQFLDALVSAGQLSDACTFLAFALPRREAVWWGVLVVRESLGPEPTAERSAALQATEAWVTAPSDETRRATMPAAEAAGFDTPVGLLAVAAFFSEGSIAPPDLPPVAPPEPMTANSVKNAITLAAVLTQPEKAPEKLARFLNEGIAVAKGTNTWSTDAPETAARKL